MKNIYGSHWMKWFLHIILWSISVYVVASYFAISNDLSVIDFLYAILFHFPLLFMVYINLQLLIPQLWRQSRYLLYAGCVILILGMGVIFHNLLFDVVGPMLLEDYLFVSFADLLSLIRIFAIYLFLSLLFSLSSSWFEVQRLRGEKTQLELDALKSQLNPHFLFNGINSIYALTLKQDPRAAATLLKLSDLLRYALDELRNETIPVEKEVEMIKSYLEIQKIRMKKPELIVTFFDLEKTKEKRIPPMLLLPVVENIFKHSNMQKESMISIVGQGSLLHFKTSNYVIESSVDQEKMTGIGISNIERRLDLLFPKKHQLLIKRDVEEYTFELNLELQ